MKGEGRVGELEVRGVFKVSPLNPTNRLAKLLR